MNGRFHHPAYALGEAESKAQLSFVAVRALLRIKFIRENAKHVVALDANAVNEDGRRGTLCVRRLTRDAGRSGLIHRAILSRVDGSAAHPLAAAAHPIKERQELHANSDNLLIDFRLGRHRLRQFGQQAKQIREACPARWSDPGVE